MSEPRDPSEGFTLDETVIAQMYEHEALLNLLIEKGVFTKEEYFDRVKEEIQIARAEGRERFRKVDEAHIVGTGAAVRLK